MTRRFAAAIAVLMAACASPPAKNACDGVECGEGRCVVDGTLPLCLCNTGFEAKGLSCVAKQTVDKCNPNPCTAPNRVCSPSAAGARCICAPGTYETAGECVVVSACAPSPCTLPNQAMCFEVDGRAICSCNAGHAPVDGGCDAEQTFDCDAKHTTGDAFEPDECPPLARDAGVGAAPNGEHSIQPIGDVDWFAVPGLAGHVYEVRATGAATMAMSIDTYGPDGATPLGFDHRGQVGAVARFKASLNGPHYARVRTFRAADTGPYTIVFADVGLDDFEDVPAKATPGMIGGTFAGELQFDLDVDVVQLSLIQGRKYELGSASADAGLPVFALDFIDPTRVTPLRRGLTVPGIVTYAKGSGTRALAVRGTPPTTQGPFQISLRDLGPDDHGDVPAEATPTVPGSDAALFENVNDTDVFSFTVEAGHFYSTLCARTATATYYPGCISLVTDATNTVFAHNNSGASPRAFLKAASAGMRYLQLSPVNQGGTPTTTYQYELRDLGLDDFGDDPASASPIGVGTSGQTGMLQSPSDRDVFSFQAKAGHIYRAMCIPVPPVSPCVPQLIAASGIVRASGQWNQAFVGQVTSWEATTDEPLYAVATSTIDWPAPGAYALTVEDLGIDDVGDSPATAKALAPAPTAFAATIEDATDVDVFTFQATAPDVFQFSCLPKATATTGCVAYLKNAAGQVLQTSSGSTAGAATVAIEATGPATYFVEVRAAQTSLPIQGLPYEYRLENLGPDDHGDTPQTATSLSGTGAVGFGVLETPGDFDVFSFAATADRIYKFSCSLGLAPSQDLCALNVRNASGALVASANGYPWSPNSVSFEAATAGQYTVEVFASLSNVRWLRRPYAYQLEEAGVDDHGDTSASATALTLPMALTAASFEWSSDVDVFSFPAVVGHAYTVRATTTAGLSCSLRDTNGTVLASSGGYSVPTGVVAPATATLYAFVSSTTTDGQAYPYSYQVSDLGPEDHGDTLATATAIAGLNVPVSGVVGFETDVDFFSIDLSAGISREAIFTSGVRCRVFDPSGNPITTDQSNCGGPFVPAVTGTYYLRVTDVNVSAPLPYSFHVQ